MNLREEILREHSKNQCNYIVNYVGSSQNKFDDLFSLFLSDDKLVSQRASWPMSYCVEAHPSLLKKHLARLFKNLEKENLHPAITRNSLRALQFIDIPEEYQGVLMNCCFDYATSPTEAIAVKALSLTLLRKLSNIYPEILPELQLIIEDDPEHQTAAFKSCARSIMRTIHSKKQT